MYKGKIVLLASISLLIGFAVIAAPGVDAPSDLGATAVSSSQIDLGWQDNSDNETGFKIERRVEGGNFSEIDEVGANITDYSDENLDPATTYYYRVRAFRNLPKKVIYSDYSNIASAVTFGVVPDDPTNLTAIASTSTYVLLFWQDNSDNEVGFSVERSENGVDYDEIATTSENIDYYYDYDVATSTLYYYQVRAFNWYGYSDYSNVATTVFF